APIRAPSSGGIEAQLEQTHKVTRDARVRRQRPLHRSLAEGHAGLQQIPAVSAQHHDFTCRKADSQQQSIETVVLDVALPRGKEGVLEQAFDARNVDAQPVAMLELEVL